MVLEGAFSVWIYFGYDDFFDWKLMKEKDSSR